MTMGARMQWMVCTLIGAIGEVSVHSTLTVTTQLNGEWTWGMCLKSVTSIFSTGRLIKVCYSFVLAHVKKKVFQQPTNELLIC